MERVNQIISHPQFQTCLQEIQSLETNREFCGHTMEHFLDVARLAYIFALEEGLLVSREVIYATAFLHDIGRNFEYTEGILHHQASARIAAEILPQCGFTDAEQKLIIDAVLSHRSGQEKGSFSEVFYRADKMSRNCFSCPAEEKCNWSTDKKNMKIQY